MTNLTLLQEISLLDRFKAAAHSFKSAGSTPAEVPDEPEGVNQQHGESSLQALLDKVFTVPSDRTRCIIYFNASDLKDRYLVKNGPTEFVKQLDQEQLASIFKDANLGTVGVPIVLPVAGSTIPMTSIPLKPAAGRPFAVLLNVPKSDAALLGHPVKDEATAREVLSKVVAHKNYVGVLNLGAARKAGVFDSKDVETQQEKFDVTTIVTAFAVRYIVDQARDEWNAKHASAKKAATAKSVPASSSVADDILQALTAAISNAIGKNGIKTNKDADKVSAAIKSVAQTNSDFKEYPGDAQKALKKLVSDTSIGTSPFDADTIQKLKRYVAPYIKSETKPEKPADTIGDPQQLVDTMMRDKGSDYAKSLLQILQHTLDKEPK